jgi:histidinol dehydrogenase
VGFIRKFDNYNVKNIKNIIITPNEIKKAYECIDKLQLTNLKKSIKRIRDFSKKQKTVSWTSKKDGSILGEKVTPIETVGIYVPAGKASYPSTVLMNAIPAKIAGVKNIIMACPISNIEDHALAIVAADLCGVHIILRMGGAHAIAALAYGTKSISKVDKIVGPGNIYVTLAKKAVFGDVGIDNIAGPSEVVIIADSSNNPDWIAMDLFSQAEHDELAQPILISSSIKLINDVHNSVEKLLPSMLRKNIIVKSFNARGMYIKTKNIKEIGIIVNNIAPEHLEIMSKNNKDLLKLITNAGAIFLGEYTPEVFGDYCAGPNHVLPTSGSARFASPLGVYDFQKRSSLISISKKTAIELSKISVSMALSEGLQGHALSAKYRDK